MRALPNSDDNDDELIEQIEERFGKKEPLNIEHEVRKRLSGKNNGTGYAQLAKEAKWLSEMRKQRAYSLAVRNSPMLAAVDALKGKAAAFLGIGSYQPSLEQITDEVIRTTNDMTRTSAQCVENSRQVIDAHSRYREEKVLGSLIGAISEYRNEKEKMDATAKLYFDVEERLGTTQVQDPQYAMLYRAHGTLKRELMDIASNISRQRMIIAFRAPQLRALEHEEEMMRYTSHQLEMLNTMVSMTAENSEHTLPSKAYMRASGENADAIHQAYIDLTRLVESEMQEMGTIVGKMADKSRQAASISVPEMLEDMLGRYKSDIISANERERQGFEKKAEDILKSYGLD